MGNTICFGKRNSRKVSLELEHILKRHQTKIKLKEKQSNNKERSMSTEIIGYTTLRSLSSSNENVNDIYVFEKKALGEGHFGIVRKAYLKYNSNRKFAIKSINKKSLNENFDLIKNELEILRVVDHPNIAKFYECYQDEESTHFVIEYCSGELLIDKIVREKTLGEGVAKRIMFEILLAINHLHHRGICHRDVKPDNFIFSTKSSNSELKLIDFGLSKSFISNKLFTVVGTPYYVAPELLEDSGYNQYCDNWSAGCIMYIMLAGVPPFYASKDTDIFKKIKKGIISLTGQLWNSISNEAKSLISKLLTKDPNLRITACQALSDPWFNEININYSLQGSRFCQSSLISNLKKFRTSSMFQKEVILLMVNLFTDAPELQHLRFSFFHLDYLHNGTISDEELKAYFEEHGEELSSAEAAELISAMHLNQEGIISYSEFLAAAVDTKFFGNEEYLELAFRRFDIDNTGWITKNNIVACFKRFGFCISESDASKMVREFVENGEVTNKSISKDEFFRVIKARSNLNR